MQKRIVAAGLAGNVLEWYDFAVYGYFAAVIGKAFFPAAEASQSVLMSLAVFAIGFLARPFGGILLGHLGDVAGRRKALVISTFMMALPSTIIGLLPTYEMAGIAAPIALIVCRLLQGASVGGELPSSVTYLFEGARPGREALMAAVPLAGAIGGILLGSSVAAVFSAHLGEEQLQAWGWRIPFLLGSVISLYAMYLRRALPHDVPRVRGDKRPPLLRILKEYRLQVVLGFGIMVFVAINFYMMYIYLTSFMSDVAGLDRSTSLEINSISMVLLIVMAFVGAWLADKFGSAPVMMTSGVLWIVSVYPLLHLMEHANPSSALAAELGLTLIFGPYNGVATYHLARMFPADVRLSGVSLVSNTCLAALGGTTPMIATYFVGTWGTPSLAAYAIAAGVCGLCCTALSSGMLNKRLAIGYNRNDW